jgi:hypothetical protein
MGAVSAVQAKLVLNSFAHVLQNNLVTASAVSWNEHSGELDDRNGLKVVEQIGPRYKVTRTENGVKDLTTGTDGSVFGGELFEITGTFNANMGWGDFTKITTVGEARESKALMGAATSMAEQIDAYILQKAVLASNNWTGTGTASVSAHIEAMAAKARLMEEGVGENDLSFIMNHTDEMLLGDQVIKLPAPDGMATSTFREGFSGRMGGIKTMFTNQLPVLTVGTRAASAASQVDGANQNVNYADVANQTTANGLYMTQLLNVKGLTAGQTIVPGEVFVQTGVNAYDNRKQAPVSPARQTQFTVVEGDTADGGGLATIRIFPAMIVPGSGAGDNININSAHATVTAAPANSAPITWMGVASSTLSPRVLIQKEAVVVNTIPLIMPANAPDAMRRKLTKIPISVRMWPHSDFNTGAHGVRFDVAMNANIRERRRISRFNGA